MPLSSKKLTDNIKIDEHFLFQELLSNTTDSIYFKDKECRFIHCSRHLAIKHGLKDADELIGKTDFELFSEEHARQAYKDEKKIMKTGEPIIGIIEKETYHDGSIRWSSTSKFPLVGPDKKIMGTFGISRDITAQKDAEDELKSSKEKIQKALKEKKILLAEVHHRVKNNLAVVLGLIELQIYKLIDTHEKIPEVLKATKTRIKSIANVHELLYQTENFASISINDLMQKLSDDIKATYNSDWRKIEFQIDFEHIVLNTYQAVPFCLLMHELIQNSYKHAFDGRETGTISISAKKEEEKVMVKYADDGRGFDDKFEEIRKSSDSLGLTLITALASQLNAEYSTDENTKGFSFKLSFNVPKNESEKIFHISEDPS